MQIKSLWIKEYKNLKDFTINFEHNVSVLIGKNGSGKSNILDAFVLIFRSLLPENEKKVPFEYKMTYIFEGNEITVDNNFYNYNNTNIPKNVIGYYYKNNGRLPVRFRGNKSKVSNFQALSVDSFNKILLSIGYSNQSDHKSLFEKIGISKIESFSFSIDFDNIYHSFLEELIPFIKDTEFGKYNRYDRFFNFVGNIFDNNEFRDKFGSEKTFFNKIEDMSKVRAIRMLNLKLLLKNGTTINSQDLSDGEKQFITTFGMATFMDDQENLFLFDEPDTFLHPNWQKEFIPSLIDSQLLGNLLDESGDKIIKESGERILTRTEIKSHFIITTHSPLLVGSSEDIDIVGLENNDGKTEIVCHTNPELFEENENIEPINVYGNRAEFIYDKVFGLKNTRAPKFIKDINKLHNLLKKKSEGKVLNDKENEKKLELKEFLKSKIGDDLDDLYLSYLSIDELSTLIKEKNEKDK